MIGQQTDCSLVLSGRLLYGLQELAPLAKQVKPGDVVTVLESAADERERVFARQVNEDGIVYLQKETCALHTRV